MYCTSSRSAENASSWQHRTEVSLNPTCSGQYEGVCTACLMSTHAMSLSRTMSPESPFCFPVFPPSTTNRSSWKNCDTTVCLCNPIVSIALYPMYSHPHCHIQSFQSTHLQRLQLFQTLLHQLLYRPLICYCFGLSEGIARASLGVFAEVVCGELARGAEEISIQRSYFEGGALRHNSGDEISAKCLFVREIGGGGVMCGERRIIWCLKEVTVMRDRKTGEVISSISSTSTRFRVAARAEVRLPIHFLPEASILREERLDFATSPSTRLSSSISSHINTNKSATAASPLSCLRLCSSRHVCDDLEPPIPTCRARYTPGRLLLLAVAVLHASTNRSDDGSGTSTFCPTLRLI